MGFINQPTSLAGWAPVFDSVKRWFIFVAEKTMVYGRYNKLVFMGIISWVINQRSHHWGGPILHDWENIGSWRDSASNSLRTGKAPLK